MKYQAFFKEAELMLKVLPIVAKEKDFALKGGTAINFFWRDIPRLSIDIDLAYIKIEDREKSLSNISESLNNICLNIAKTNRTFKVHKVFKNDGSKRISKLIITDGSIQVKIEPNEILRGFVYNPADKTTSKETEKIFEQSITIKSLSFADLYGGKLCAALDRQHPRDIFDMKLLLENEGFTDEIRKAFLVYLISHDRPITELLEPVRKDIKKIFEQEFQGMTRTEVNLESLLAIREKYIGLAVNTLTERERAFLISFKDGTPNWKLLEINNIDLLPSIQWKLKNVITLKIKNKTKHEKLLETLKAKLDL